MVFSRSVFKAVIFQQGLVVVFCKEREFIVTCLVNELVNELAIFQLLILDLCLVITTNFFYAVYHSKSL